MDKTGEKIKELYVILRDLPDFVELNKFHQHKIVEEGKKGLYCTTPCYCLKKDFENSKNLKSLYIKYCNIVNAFCDSNKSIFPYNKIDKMYDEIINAAKNEKIKLYNYFEKETYKDNYKKSKKAELEKTTNKKSEEIITK